jgi:ABC-type transport system substrate-binding protein
VRQQQPHQHGKPGATTGNGGISIPATINSYNSAPSGTKVAGGTVYWAQAPSGAPNYIFPMTNAQVCGVKNTDYLSDLLYRPLYWFGNHQSPTVDYSYSIGQAPVWTDNDQTVTVHLNNWKWADGEQVTSRDVEFYITGAGQQLQQPAGQVQPLPLQRGRRPAASIQPRLEDSGRCGHVREPR